MPKHDVWVSFPPKALKNVDTTIAIWSDGALLGELNVSRGSADWRSRRKKTPKRITWERFADILDEA